MPNEEQIAHWSGDAGEHWARERERHDRMLRPFGERVIEALAPEPGERVIDVGCGNGWLSIAIASRVGPKGEVVGVDISGPMLATARAQAEAAAVPTATFLEADAQAHRFEPGSFDGIVSRFGVMFFDDPVAAFGNLASALRPGGRIAFVCWRELLVNEWMMVPAGAVLQHVPMPQLGGGGEGPPGPGPFSLADPDRIRSVLGDAGLTEVELREVDEPTWMGESGEDTLTFLKRTEMARVVLGDASEETAAKAWASVREVLDERATDDGVVLTGSAWLVTARR